MGSWGYEPFESDSDLDWRGDFNDDLGLRKALIKEVKQKKWATVSRAAIEYAIRMDDAGLITVYGDDEFIDIMLKRAKELKKEFADPSGYGRDDNDPDDDSLRQATRGYVRSMDRQLKYLEALRSKKAAHDSKAISKGDISKSELMDAFDRLKKRTAKDKGKARKPKSKGPIADRKARVGSRKELMDAYAKLKGSKGDS